MMNIRAFVNTALENKPVLFAGLGVASVGWWFLNKYFNGGICTTTHLLKNKSILITGGNTGIGKETAQELAKVGAKKITIACRDKARGEKSLKDIQKYASTDTLVNLVNLDLADLKSVKQCAENLASNDEKFDILINNAGVMRTPYLQTEQGYEYQFGTNHLGHFYFTHLLLYYDLINENGRIINLSSLYHNALKTFSLDILNPSKQEYECSKSYAISKYCNVLFTKELQRRLNEGNKSITTYALHPGVVRTELTRNEYTIAKAFLLLFYPLVYTFTKSPLQGAQTTLFCASSPDILSDSGKYFSDCACTKENVINPGEKDQRDLWKYSEDIIREFEKSLELGE